MESYIAGQLYCLPYILPMFAPTVNSYKRLRKVPGRLLRLPGVSITAPLLCGYCRGRSATRLETRVVGSDANPYLAMAACLAAGLYGIKNKLNFNN